MSWDVMLFDFDGNPPDFGHLPDDFEPPLMGDVESLRGAISKVLPGVDWSRRDWGVLEGEGWSIEFSQKAEGDVSMIMLFVRGGGDPVGNIVKLCKAYNWSAFDISAGDFIDLANPSDEGWTGFQTYRDSVIVQSTQNQDASAWQRLYLPIGLGIVIILIMILSLWYRKTRDAG